MLIRLTSCKERAERHVTDDPWHAADGRAERFLEKKKKIISSSFFSTQYLRFHISWFFIEGSLPISFGINTANKSTINKIGCQIGGAYVKVEAWIRLENCSGGSWELTQHFGAESFQRVSTWYHQIYEIYIKLQKTALPTPRNEAFF